MKKITITFLVLLIFINASIASVIVQNGLSHIHNISGSTIQEGSIIIQNTGKAKERVKLYLSDISTKCDGSISYEKSGTNASSLSPYLSIANQEITLSSFERYEIIYQIDISNTELNSGSYWSLIMVDIEEPISMDNSNPGFKIGSKIRYAVQVIANLGLDGPNNIQFSNVQLKQEKELNKTTIDVSLFNGGNYMVSPKLELKIYDSLGMNIDNILINPKKLYPNNCQNFQILLNDLPKGNYKGVLVAEYNDEQSIGVNLEIKI
jgi:hypothetical protein